MMSREQFLAEAQEQGVLARDEVESWQRELKDPANLKEIAIWQENLNRLSKSYQI